LGWLSVKQFSFKTLITMELLYQQGTRPAWWCLRLRESLSASVNEADLETTCQVMLRPKKPIDLLSRHHSRIIKFPNTLNKEDTRKAISIAFTKWSDVSPLTFIEVTDGNATADITIGMSHSFYTFNHTDCWWSPLHPCFDGLNGELAHAFLPPRGEIHFDNHEFWILGKSRFSWKQGDTSTLKLINSSKQYDSGTDP
ncbi:hypothetical protein GOODEAATRI_032747, partial [Goodea atripinnis]